MIVNVSLMLNIVVPLVISVSLDGRSKKNHYWPSNKDRYKTVIRGGSVKNKRSKQLGPTLVPLPSMLVGHFPRIVIEMKNVCRLTTMSRFTSFLLLKNTI